MRCINRRQSHSVQHLQAGVRPPSTSRHLHEERAEYSLGCGCKRKWTEGTKADSSLPYQHASKRRVSTITWQAHKWRCALSVGTGETVWLLMPETGELPQGTSALRWVSKRHSRASSGRRLSSPLFKLFLRSHGACASSTAPSVRSYAFSTTCHWTAVPAARWETGLRSL